MQEPVLQALQRLLQTALHQVPAHLYPWQHLCAEKQRELFNDAMMGLSLQNFSYRIAANSAMKSFTESECD